MILKAALLRLYSVIGPIHANLFNMVSAQPFEIISAFVIVEANSLKLLVPPFIAPAPNSLLNIGALYKASCIMFAFNAWLMYKA